MGSSFNDRGYLVLDPYSASADRALQKRLKEQQKQAAAAAAQAAAGSTPAVLGRLSSAARDKLARAKARLDTLDLYPRPVRMRRVRLVSAPWLFRLPWFRRFDGYTMWDLILVRAPVAEAGDDLVTHELCHVWQMQHHPLAMPLSYLYRGYSDNPNEVQARRAAELTAPRGALRPVRLLPLSAPRADGPRLGLHASASASRIDSSFPKYPRVPVTECRGYEPAVVGPMAEGDR